MFNPDVYKQIEIHSPELLDLLKNSLPEHLLIDVREAFELSRGILPGATHLPMSQIQARTSELDQSKTIICYCEHGVRSLDVAAWLTSLGFKARSLSGGFADWSGPIAKWEP